jgi:hypothetical protein
MTVPPPRVDRLSSTMVDLFVMRLVEQGQSVTEAVALTMAVLRACHVRN